MDEPNAPEVESRFDVPDEWRVGLYANNVNVWHSPYEFTLDFAISEPPEVSEGEDVVTIPNMVVARIRIPTSLIFGVLSAINTAMAQYEQAWGEIREPEWQGGGDDEEA